MKIRDLHNDVARYLQNDCYCPNEIYDESGFFFRCFTEDEECKILGKHEESEKSGEFIACISDNQILIFWTKGESVIGATRYDATENNIKIVKMIIVGKDVSKMSLDEFTPGESQRSLEQILKVADAIMI